MKKFYETPALELISFSVENVLTASGGNPVIESGGTGTEIGGPIDIF